MARIFALSEAAFRKGTDYDIVMLYQLLLGRNPENSQVIQDHRANPLSTALHTFVSSPEFRESVLDPIAAGAKVRRHDMVPRPSPDQLAWLFNHTILDDAVKSALRQAEDWERFFQTLCALDGFLDPPPPPPATIPVRPPIVFASVPRPALAPPARLSVGPGDPAYVSILARLDRLEAQLAALTGHAQPAPAKPAGGKAKASSKRQAR